LAGRTYQGKVVSVTDGDTINLLVNGEKLKVRLAEIDAPERGQPWGRRARAALAEKVARQSVNVDEVGRDRYGDIIGKLWFGDRYINRELLQEGHAWADRKYPQDQTLLGDEAAAKKAMLGQWSLPESKQVPPWVWRSR
jgi:endonuclease YncB( thermonuclease family)